MNRERDFDETLRRWLDDGADQAPERFVWAALEDVERTAQRGAWKALLEGFLMKLKPAAPYLGVAAVVLLAVAAYQLFGGNVGSPTAPNPTPRSFVAPDLPNLILTRANAPEGLIVDNTTLGTVALNTPMRPGGQLMPTAGYVDALMTNLNSIEAGGFVTWSALYETTAQAEAAFDVLVTEHEAADGWGLERSATAPPLGHEAVLYAGAAYDFDDARIYLWRVNNVLLAAVAVDVAAVDSEMAAQIEEIADGMDLRAR
jgi:hypothetical protein